MKIHNKYDLAWHLTVCWVAHVTGIILLGAIVVYPEQWIKLLILAVLSFITSESANPSNAKYNQ